LAAKSDAVILVTGLSPEWEAEGFDRPTLDMPGRQNELIQRVGQANPNTVVCLQAVSVLCAVAAQYWTLILNWCERALLLPCHG
jgi:beta-glucosidase